MRYRTFLSSLHLGLDIQPDQLRLVLLRKVSRRFFLERHDIIHLPATILAEKKESAWQIITTELVEYVKRYKLHGVATAVSLPANLVIMQALQVSAGLSHERITAEIVEKVQENLRSLPDALCIDYTVIQSTPKSSHIFFAAANKASVVYYEDCLREAGLNIKIMDVDMFALNRAICFALKWPDNDDVNHGLLAIKKETVSFIVLRGHHTLFYQTWNTLSEADLLAQFKNKLQLYASTSYGPLQRLAVWAAHDDYQLLIENDSYPWQMVYANSNQHALSLPAIETNALQTLSAHYFVACGAALQEFPAWS